MTESKLSIRGIYRDVVEDAEHRVVYDSGWVSNTIVTRCRVLLASFMKNEAASGIQYLAVGQGLETWDDNPETPEAGDEALVDKQWFKVDDLEMVYFDPTAGPTAEEGQEAPSAGIRITATLEPGYPPPEIGLDTYPLREFGLFGWLGDPDSGEAYMINNVRHPVIHKDASATLIRDVRLYF